MLLLYGPQPHFHHRHHHLHHHFCVLNVSFATATCCRCCRRCGSTVWASGTGCMQVRRATVMRRACLCCRARRMTLCTIAQCAIRTLAHSHARASGLCEGGSDTRVSRCLQPP
jgi:hypothetical protein